MNYLSQYKQDKFIDYLFSKKKNGVFLDIGAYDGITISNTCFFEKERFWKGICIEPMPRIFEKLKANRHSILENCCILDKEGSVIFREITGYPEMLSGILDFFDNDHIERINNEIALYGGTYQDIPIKCRNINNILLENDLYDIDYCSIDTEGAEYPIVTSIDFEKYNIKVFTIERSEEYKRLRFFLKKKGYRYIRGENDDFFIKKDIPRFPLLIAHIKYYKFILTVKYKIHKLKTICMRRSLSKKNHAG
jgi:FkbM family methyltransferase